jgi:putative membrane protein insertion efficiency factor
LRVISLKGHHELQSPLASIPASGAPGDRRLRVLFPALPPACRFEPSCSLYADQAIERYGLIRGLGLAIVRLAKCHPFHPGGFDPLK